MINNGSSSKPLRWKGLTSRVEGPGRTPGMLAEHFDRTFLEDKFNTLYLQTLFTGAVLITPLSLTKRLSHSSFSSKSSKLKLWENVHLPPYVTCHVSNVMCHLSNVRFFSVSIYLLLYIVVKLVVEGSVVNGAYPV